MSAMDAIKQTFFEECDEQLIELERGLLEIEEGSGDRETVNAVFRAVHSIKGGAGAFQLNDLVRFAHTFETTLDLVREDKLDPGPDVMRTMLRASDVLADLVAGARDDRAIPPDTWEPIVAELAAYCGEDEHQAHAAETGSVDSESDEIDSVGTENNDGAVFEPLALSLDDMFGEDEDAGEGENGDAVFQPLAMSLDDLMGGDGDEASNDNGLNEFAITFKPHPDLYTSANDPCLLLKELARLGDTTVECLIDDVPCLDDFSADGAYLGWSIKLATQEDESAVSEIFEFVEDICELEIAQINKPIELPSIADEVNGDLVTVEVITEDPETDTKLIAESVADELVVDDFAVQDSPAEVAAPETEGLLDSAPLVEPTGAVDKAEDKPKSAEADASPAAEKTVRNQTIRADLKRVDRLINLVGELVINQAMLSQSVARAGLESATDVVTGLDELEQLTRQIQDSVMAIRAQPVKPMFQRMSRVVREAADATGKVARLKMEGDSTEVDKTVIEKLADPLTHMIRNAVDHGLESTEKRIEAGKPEEGTVRLSAAHRSGRVVIEVSDDGAGINRERVKAIAVEKGIVAPDAQLSDSEIDNLIFAPGFSTASEVSDLSGRGVGMDVVRRSIQAVGGRVTISSDPGNGSTFTMSLPLTLAVLDGMIVSVAGQTLVIPITAIVETLKPTANDVHQMGSDNHMISIRSRFVPLIDVGQQLGFRNSAADTNEGVVVLIETDDGDSHALHVDSIQDQSQVVIKSLETNYGHVDGVAAATILGDGRVALIADVDGLVEHARVEPVRTEPVLALAG